MPVTWNSADAGTHIRLTGADLICDVNDASDRSEIVRATSAIDAATSGIAVAFRVAGTVTGSRVGLAKVGHTLDAALGGTGENGYGSTSLSAGSAHKGPDDATITGTNGFTAGLYVLYLIKSGSVYVYNGANDGTWSGCKGGQNPEAGTGGIWTGLSGNLYPAAEPFHASSAGTVRIVDDPNIASQFPSFETLAASLAGSGGIYPVPSTGLIYHIPLGTDGYVDLGPSEYTVTPNNSPTAGSGFNGGVIPSTVFTSASSQSVSIGTSSNLIDITNSDFTITCWVRQANIASPSFNPLVLVKDTLAAPFQIFLSQTTNYKDIYFRYKGDTVNRTALIPGWANNIGVHVALVWNHTTATYTLYINGSTVSVTTGGAAAGVTNENRLGASSSFSSSVELAQVTLHSVQLTAEEIQAMVDYTGAGSGGGGGGTLPGAITSIIPTTTSIINANGIIAPGVI